MRVIYALLIGTILLSGCAMRYRQVHPEGCTYFNKNENACLDYSYSYDVLARSGNRKYARKEKNHYMRVVAVAITNRTNKKIIVRNDVQFKINNHELTLMGPDDVRRRIHQSVLPYVLYSFITFYITKSNAYGTVTEHHVYPIGVLIALGNMILAANANENFSDELWKYNLIAAAIEPGETKYGLIGFSAYGNEPIAITLKNGDCGTENIPAPIPQPGEKHSMDLPNVMYYTSADSTYENYIKRLESLLKQDIGIIKYKYVELKRGNGKIVERGMTARHKYKYYEDEYNKIGTWEYYNKEGKLEKTKNYDLQEKVIKTVEY